MKRSKNHIQNCNGTWLLLGAFGIPFILMFVAFAINRFYPFGDKSVLIMDMSDQYVEFFRGLYHFGQNANMLFSWSKGLGQNNIGLFAYYLASPFSSLILLFPERALLETLFVITLLKIGCSGWTFAYFLRIYTQKSEWKQLPFACAYALMSYNVVYAMSLMWLDGVILLPLMLIGVLRILRDDRPAVLLISFAYLCISNYYIAYPVFWLTFFFFLYAYFGAEIGPRNSFFRKLCSCAFSIIGAAGLGAWLLVPTLVSLLQGKMSGNGATSTYVPFSAVDLLGKIMPGQYDSLTNSGLPSIYCGSAAILCLIWFFARSAPHRNKIAAAGLLGFLCISFCCPILDLFWHVFQVPNWFPYRYAFGFSGFLLFFAYQGISENTKLSFRRKCVAFAVSGIMTVLCAVQADLDSPTVWIVFLLLAVVGSMQLINRRLLRTAFGIFAGGLLAVELTINASGLIQGLDRQFQYQSRSDYIQFQDQLQTLVNMADADCDVPFYRMEKDYERSKNDAIGGGYNGITHYSSSYLASVNRLTKQLGLAQDWFWNSYYGATPITDALFSVRYTMRKNSEIDPAYVKVGSVGDVALWRNDAVFPLAFSASSNTVQDRTDQKNVLDYQEKILEQLTGTSYPVWNSAELIEVHPVGFHAVGKSYFGEAGSSIQYVFRTTYEGPVYAYFPGSNPVSCRIYVNGTDRGEYFGSESSRTVYMGSFSAGDEIEVMFRLHSGSIQIDEPICATFDWTAFGAALDSIAGHDLKISNFSVTRISGTVNAEEDGVLYTSIPYDSGWTVRIDGKKVRTFAYCNTLLMTELQAGNHTVEFTFSPVGFRPGVLISIVSLLIIGIWIGIRRKIRSAGSCSTL